MDYLNSLFGGNSGAVSLVLLFVGLTVALILLFWVWRKITAGSQLRGGRSRQPRLSVTDAAIVDDKRRLVLVRRDNVEHLLMIGGPGDIVIEQNIVRHQSAAPQPQPVVQEHPVAEPNSHADRAAGPVVAGAVAAGAAIGSLEAGVRERTSALLKPNATRSEKEPAPAPDVTNMSSQSADQDGSQLDDFEVENFDLVDEENGIDLETELETELAQAETAPVSQTTFAQKVGEPDFDAMLSEHIATPSANGLHGAANGQTGFVVDTPAIDAAPEPVSSPADDTDGNDMEDEMQKLLNELSVGR